MLVDSLEYLVIKAPLVPPALAIRDQVVSLTSLTTIRTDLNTLACNLYFRYSFPSLRHLTILQGTGDTLVPLDKWEAFATAADGGSLVETVQISVWEDADSVAPMLLYLPKLRLLDLSGDATEQVLDALRQLTETGEEDSDLPIPTLQELHVATYSGNGMSILEFVCARRTAGT
jgi:hypothetical protein